MPATARKPDASRRSERSRRAILDAALDQVGETGYEKLTIEGIAARAGVGKQTIYRWWPSKAAVLLDAFTAVSEDAAQGQHELPDTGDLEADLKEVLRATVDELNRDVYDRPARALAAAAVTDPALAEEFNRRVLGPQLDLYVERFTAARAAGHIADDVDVRVATDLLVGPLAHRWLLRTLPMDHAYADRVVELALRGIAA
ncbi:TetR/AcrR family transcriptional regulator [Streptomyces sp. A7024]|uniref:TetR/AcrR family transcriptional regulator n=1 Tax=Streptomyces coryli TaxID=1128680 RepID=A0A6G4TVW1_9ACTN|nr:TetR/AcrR family transcriptional regulator [Streptomyces coryli]NGN63248.1 TetR/AcrR family transcriptional regulator [Streptomyces coryli]